MVTTRKQLRALNGEAEANPAAGGKLIDLTAPQKLRARSKPKTPKADTASSSNTTTKASAKRKGKRSRNPSEERDDVANDEVDESNRMITKRPRTEADSSPAAPLSKKAAVDMTTPSPTAEQRNDAAPVTPEDESPPAADAQKVQTRRRRLTLNTTNDFRGLLDNTYKREQKEHSALQLLSTHVVAKTPNQKARDRRSRGSIGGTGPHLKQESYDNKFLITENAEQLKRLGIGFACKKGLKPEAPNQDDFSVIWHDPYRLYCVFDGHGPYGHNISSYVQNDLPQEIVKVMQAYKHDDPDLNDAITQAFKSTHACVQKLSTSGEKKDFDATLSGSTASMVWHDNEHLHCAHVGDSRSVLASMKNPDKPDELQAIDLSDDHKPELPEEKARIVASGGEVKKMVGDIPHRVFAKGQYYPGLAMSRAMGDLLAARVGVSCEPSISHHTLEPEHQFVVCCTDGVWEFISSQEAVDLVAPYGPDGAHEAAEALAKLSWDKWIEVEGNVVDDITVIVSWISHSRALQLEDDSEDGDDKDRLDVACSEIESVKSPFSPEQPTRLTHFSQPEVSLVDKNSAAAAETTNDS